MENGDFYGRITRDEILDPDVGLSNRGKIYGLILVAFGGTDKAKIVKTELAQDIGCSSSLVDHYVKIFIGAGKFEQTGNTGHGIMLRRLTKPREVSSRENPGSRTQVRGLGTHLPKSKPVPQDLGAEPRLEVGNSTQVQGLGSIEKIHQSTDPVPASPENPWVSENVERFQFLVRRFGKEAVELARSECELAGLQPTLENLQKILYRSNTSDVSWTDMKNYLSGRISPGSLNVIEKALISVENGQYIFADSLPDYLKDLLSQVCDHVFFEPAESITRKQFWNSAGG